MTNREKWQFHNKNTFCSPEFRIVTLKYMVGQEKKIYWLVDGEEAFLGINNTISVFSSCCACVGIDGMRWNFVLIDNVVLDAWS